MARTASRGFSPDTFKAWAKSHHEEIRAGGVAAAVAFFFTQGLPLWNEDYGQWLAQANEGFFRLLFRLISPVTIEPQTWGYSDRPGQVFVYKVLSLLFGSWGTGYFFVKSLVFGALIGTLYRWMRKLGIDRTITWLSLAVFASSTNVLAAVIWHSDFSVYSQLILALILLWALPEVEKGPSSFQIYRKGLGNLPRNFVRFCVLFTVFVYFGSKVRADVRLAPLVLLGYLALFRREKAKVYAAPLGIAFLTTLPWSTGFFRHLPPFIPGAAGYQGQTFGAFSLTRVFEFLFSGLFSLHAAPLSVIGGAGVLFVLVIACYGIFRLFQERFEAPDAKWGFFLVWFALALVVCGMTAPQGAAIQIRYTFLALVPGIFLLALSAQAAFREFGRRPWFQYVAYGVVALQCGFHVYHDIGYRRATGGTVVSVDKAFAEVERRHGNAQLVLAPGFPAYGYRASPAGVIQGRKSLATFDELVKYPSGNTWVIGWNPSLDSRFSVEARPNGCGDAIFDKIAGCSKGGTVVMKYVGVPPELAQADQLDKQGNLPAARQVVEGYLTKDPGNDGMAFVASLYAYRSGDFARMEQIYERIGPAYEHHPSVVYNWGLAKQGQRKFAEATRLFEAAYAMVPRDYSIGFNLADSYFHEGKKSRALATVDDLMKKYPNNDALKNAYNSWSK